MDLKYLVDFIRGKALKEGFLSSVKKEIQEYVKSLNEGKNTSNLIVSNEDFDLDFKLNDLTKLLELYLNNDILEWDLEYILNVLDMCSWEFEDKVQEVIFNMSTPEINFPINQENINTCIKYLEDKTEKLELKSLTRISYSSVFNNFNLR